MSTVDIKIEVTKDAEYLIDSPTFANIRRWELTQNYPHDAGFDIPACLKEISYLQPGKYALIPTGMKIQLPIGWELQIRPRSGLAINKGITVLNTPGTVDYSYRSEIKVILYNASMSPFEIRPGDRIAQACIREVPVVNIEYVDQIAETIEQEIKDSSPTATKDLKEEMAAKLNKKRGGFGSSGV